MKISINVSIRWSDRKSIVYCSRHDRWQIQCKNWKTNKLTMLSYGKYTISKCKRNDWLFVQWINCDKHLLRNKIIYNNIMMFTVHCTLQHSEIARLTARKICNRKKFQWNWINSHFRIAFISIDPWAPLDNISSLFVVIEINRHFSLLSLCPDVLSSKREIQRFLSNNWTIRSIRTINNANSNQKEKKTVNADKSTNITIRNVNFNSAQNNTSNDPNRLSRNLSRSAIYCGI